MRSCDKWEYHLYDIDSDECVDCYREVGKPNFTPVKIPDLTCENCMYNHLQLVDIPCWYCDDYSEWKPKSGHSAWLKPVGNEPEISKTGDPVNHPGHYTSLPIEAIKAIKLLVTEVYGEDGFRAYCFGNELKYRLRAGFKGPAEEEIGKALKYREFREDDGQD